MKLITCLFALAAVTALVSAQSPFRLTCDDTLNLQINKGFHYQLRATGGTGRYRYTVSSLPPGLKMQGPVIAGLPTTVGTYGIAVRGYDERGNSAIKNVNFIVGTGDDSSDQKVTFSSVGKTITFKTMSNSQSSSSSSSGFSRSGSISLGPYSADANGYPIFEKDENGNYVFMLDSNGRVVLPRDADGFSMYPYNDVGEPILPTDASGRIAFPLNANGLPILPRNKIGLLVYPRDSQGRPLVPLDDKGNKLYPKDGNGNFILP